jgi:hypothetical protein
MRRRSKSATTSRWADGSLPGAEEFELGEGPAGHCSVHRLYRPQGLLEQSERLDDRCCVAVGGGSALGSGVGDDIADPDGPNSLRPRPVIQC